MLCGYEPFFGVSDEELISMNKMVKYEFEEPEWSSISATAKELVCYRMLVIKTACSRTLPLDITYDGKGYEQTYNTTASTSTPFLKGCCRNIRSNSARRSSFLQSTSIIVFLIKQMEYRDISQVENANDLQLLSQSRHLPNTEIERHPNLPAAKLVEITAYEPKPPTEEE
jgi:hypothetical protein